MIYGITIALRNTSDEAKKSAPTVRRRYNRRMNSATASTSLVPDTAIVAMLRDQLPGVQAIYRYGSAGTEFERPESDVDLAVLAERPIDLQDLLATAAKLTRLLRREVDLNDMQRLPVTLRVQIVTGGQRLFAADHALAEAYDSRVLSDYAHLNEARRGILDDIRMRGSIHG